MNYNINMKNTPTKDNIFSKALYYSFISTQQNLPINPLVVGFERCKKNKSPIFSDKTCYTLHVILSGEGTVLVNNETYNIKSETVYILPPHSNAIYKPIKTNPWSYIWIEFSGDIIKQLLQNINFTNTNFIYKPKNFAHLKDILTLMLKEDDNITTGAEALLIESFIFRIFAFLIDEYSNNKENYITKKEITTSKITKYLDDHFCDEDISIKKVADNFFFSQPYLTRFYKSQTGVTPIQYVIQLRMRKACELLNHKTFTIEQISENLGYKNQFYFSKEFKKYYLVPPTQYKQKYKK